MDLATAGFLGLVDAAGADDDDEGKKKKRKKSGAGTMYGRGGEELQHRCQHVQKGFGRCKKPLGHEGVHVVATKAEERKFARDAIYADSDEEEEEEEEGEEEEDDEEEEESEDDDDEEWSEEEEEQQAKRGFLARVSANQRTSRMQARMSRMSGRGGGLRSSIAGGVKKLAKQFSVKRMSVTKR